ncbi:MAG: AAA family ATPase [Deltaproteobacteria bacterium]|nr:AAA family ATPase [Deltaproteobacteria bacterium]
MSAERAGSVITFYSYKGGVGRTFLLANVAATLRQWGARVLCVDWDLEAPGLHHYLRPQGEPTVGLIDVIEGFVPGVPLAWSDALCDGPVLNRAAPRGHLQLLLAGGAEGYGARMQALDWRKLYQNGLGDAIERMREEWRRAYDFVLVDSRTGLSDLAGICTIQLPDLLVLVGTASQQSIDGLREVLGMVARGRDALPYERAAVHVLPVLSRFDQRVEHDRAKDWSKRFFAALAPAFTSWLNADIEPERLAPRLRVPHVPYWGFGEGLPVESEDLHDPDAVSSALQSIAALLEHHLVDAHRIIDDRDALLAESKRRTAGFETDLLIVAEGGEANPLAIEVRSAVDPSKRVLTVAEAQQDAVLGAAAVLLITEKASPAFVRAIADIPGWVFGKNDPRVNIAVLDAEPTTRRGPLGSLRHYGREALVAEWFMEGELVRPLRGITQPLRQPRNRPNGEEPTFDVWVSGGPILRRVETSARLRFTGIGICFEYESSISDTPDLLRFDDISGVRWNSDHEYEDSGALRIFLRLFLRVVDRNGIMPEVEVSFDFDFFHGYNEDDEPSDAERARLDYSAKLLTSLIEKFTGLTAVGPAAETA